MGAAGHRLRLDDITHRFGDFLAVSDVALDIVGDKWSLLIVRDMRHGKRTYSELAASAEGIPTNILADRLRRMEEAGLIEAKPYQERPVRYAYELTAKGRGLGGVLGALARWGRKHIAGTVVAPEFRKGPKALDGLYVLGGTTASSGAAIASTSGETSRS